MSMIDGTHRGRRTAQRQAFKKGTRAYPSGAPEAGLKSPLHTVCDGRKRSLVFFPSASQVGDAKGTLAFLGDLPAAKVLPTGKGRDPE